MSTETNRFPLCLLKVDTMTCRSISVISILPCLQPVVLRRTLDNPDNPLSLSHLHSGPLVFCVVQPPRSRDCFYVCTVSDCIRVGYTSLPSPYSPSSLSLGHSKSRFNSRFLRYNKQKKETGFPSSY